MKAIILSAGQGKSLLPLTAREPKCLLAVDGPRPLLELQLRALARCGVDRAEVVVGFGAEHVEQFLARTPLPGLRVTTRFNPFYSVSDNLATCWMARDAMREDFLLLNGDTLFEDRVLECLLTSPAAPVTVTIDHKDAYDDDDMKVTLDADGRLQAIGKRLPPERVHGESIGLLAFRGDGPGHFRSALDRAVREPDGLRAWYLSVVDALAREGAVATAAIPGLWWREIDAPEDLEEARMSCKHLAPADPPVHTATAAS